MIVKSQQNIIELVVIPDHLKGPTLTARNGSAFKPIIGGGFSRPRVGADPRDSKNPLSVSQMTGNPDQSAGL